MKLSVACIASAGISLLSVHEHDEEYLCQFHSTIIGSYLRRHYTRIITAIVIRLYNLSRKKNPNGLQGFGGFGGEFNVKKESSVDMWPLP
jgi:hypothetical protein